MKSYCNHRLTQNYFCAAALLLVVLVSACQQGEQSPKTATKSTSAAIAVGKGPDALFLTPDERFLYVANVEDTTISVIDTQTDTVAQTIPGIPYPWGFVRLDARNEVAVSGWGKTVAVIDFTRHEIVRKQRYELNLGGITASPDGSTLFVVATEGNKVLKIDAATLTILDEYPTGNGPDGIGISKDGRKIYVTNTKDGSISIIGLADQSHQTLQTGGKPELIHYNHDHTLLFISNFLENKVHILNTDTDEIVHEISGLDGPEEAVLSPDEMRLFVVNFNSAKVYVYDARTYQKLPQTYPTGNKPIGVMPLRNGKLYISNYGDNSVSVIRIESIP
jgi:YVTN family beta-propeller protein